MAYRGCSRFHKITHTVWPEKPYREHKTESYQITLTKESGEKFKGETLFEISNDNYIILIKSGCDMFSKSGLSVPIIDPNEEIEFYRRGL